MVMPIIGFRSTPDCSPAEVFMKSITQSPGPEAPRASQMPMP